MIQSQPNPFVSQCRDRRSEKETALAWDVRPEGEGVGMPVAGEHPHLAGWMERATGFLLRTKGLNTRRKAVGVGISSFVAGEYAMRGEKSVPKATKISV